MFDFQKDPFANFDNEFAKAKAQAIPEFNAMALATVTLQGQPAVRTVLYKGMVRGGFSFYTNYESAKGRELLGSGTASLLFFWPQLQQQIRIFGEVDKLTRAESEAYFRTRPRLSQIGAWASHQSEVINDFSVLEKRVEALEKKYSAGVEIPCPPNWGGFRLQPLMIEFWFGREGRLHERYVYERGSVSGSWQRSLKSP